MSEHNDRAVLVSLAVAYGLLVVASVGSLALLRQDVSLQGMVPLNPFGPPEQSRNMFATNPEAVRVGAFFDFASAIPLAIYTAVMVDRLQLLGVRHAGTQIGFAGGLAASGGLAAAGLFLWVLSVPEAVASVPVARVLHFLVFLCGGPGFAVGMGLFAGGVSASGHGARFLPGWVVWLGLVIAATGSLASLGLLSLAMTVAIPVTRVGGFIWLIAAGALMANPVPRFAEDQ